MSHRSLYRGKPPALETMDRAFHSHIVRNRANPAMQSVNNPAPDYYGEKVGYFVQKWYDC
jgi:import inner membrane translocase subunit TIM23